MQPFKTFFSLFSLIFFITINSAAQTPLKYYEKEWKKVHSLAKKNLPKSAFAEVKKIYALAKKEKQDAQVIKALVYMIGLQQTNRENNELLSIREIENEIAGSRHPATSILKSMLADLYWNYYSEHRWQLYNRTKTYNYQKYDITSWDAEDFHKKITELHLQAIKEEKLLQQTRVEIFNAIVIPGNTRKLRPTLFDLLAHRALEYFSNDEIEIKKPAYNFEIDHANAFDAAADFVKLKFTTQDSLSSKHKALLLYQKLVAFHLNDKQPDALLDADISRIEYVYQHSTHSNKDSIYINSLTNLIKQYPGLPAAAQASYLLANYYFTTGNEYAPYGDTINRFLKVKAKEICEEIIKQKENSEGKINCANLLGRILHPEIHFSVETVNSPELPFRVFVDYKNVTTLYLRLIKYDEPVKKQFENINDENFWKAVASINPYSSWEQPLPATNDHQSHGVEIKINGLPAGKYMLAASNKKDYKTEDALIGARVFYVSNISYVEQDHDYFVLHRETGKPLANVSVQEWIRNYDYNTSKYSTEKGKRYITNENGFFKRIRSKEENNRREAYQLELIHENDSLFIDEFDYDNYYYNDEATSEPAGIQNVFLFTDRSLYRPGQTVYFKGIAVTRNISKRNAAVNSSYEGLLYLRDANYQQVDSIKVKANEYGSFSGKFQLPAGGLNGQFSIFTKDKFGSTSFRMEEYKRPKFFVEYEPVKETFKVNDEIKITGLAKAYAGNTIDGATVKYRVVRQPRYIYYWMFRRGWQPPSDEMEIKSGTVKTDKEGKFTITFTAIPDPKVDKKTNPLFDYTVYADVTDINGETRSGEKQISVSYQSVFIKAELPDALPADSLHTLFIRTENVSGEFVPATVTVKLTPLKEEKRLIRKRYWDRPDQFVMTKEEYTRTFPFDEYDNETDNSSWEKEQVVFEKSDSTKENGEWKTEKGKWGPGFYEIEITTGDKNGEEVKDVKLVELTDEKNNQLTSPEFLWTDDNPVNVQPGGKAILSLGSSAADLFVIQQLEKSMASSLEHQYSLTSLNNEKKKFELPVTEADRGGFTVGWMFVKNNRVYQSARRIPVAWDNKDLVIEYGSYRDKTLPGSEEKWKIKISGSKKEKVSAEMLAGMYDASLDQFYQHQWEKPGVWPYHYANISWTSNSNFGFDESRQKYLPVKELEEIKKEYDRLLSSFVFSPDYRYSSEPLWWLNPLEYVYSEMRNPRLMRLPKPVFANEGQAMAFKASGGVLPDSDNDGITDQFDLEENKQEEIRKKKETEQVQIRKNFNETAFFFPDLNTNENGDIEFSFTLPEALTKWKFQALAHTKELAMAYSSREIITQKQLMVQPNAPRFLREGDKIEFSAKIVNMTDKELTGQAELQLFDAATNESVSGWFKNMFPNQYFTVAAGQSEALSFPLEIPYQYNSSLVWRIVARAGNISDGEEAAMPVLTNRMLVTETLPLNMRTAGTKDFKFEKLVNTKSETLQHYSLTAEFSSNPAWYAVQALPYLMEYPYECAEQTWNRYYANALASMIANSSPRIKEIFETWNTKDTAALLSNIMKNQELKSVLLEETPWVLQAKTEEQQKKNIALLFDMIKMSSELNTAYEKLKQMQSSNGGFVWFKGGPDNRYITQYIIAGIGHLKKMGVDIKKLDPIVKLAIPYLDKKIKEDYDLLKKNKTDLKTFVPGYSEIQYLYMRSFFTDQKIAAASQTAFDYYRGRTQLTWVKQNRYMQGMAALALHRSGDTKTPAAILKSLKENSITHEELGMYWKDNSGGWYWHQAPIETQALLTEAFFEITKDIAAVNEMRTWLLKNKQTSNWKTTKATAEACYALLLQGHDILSNNPEIEIQLGNSTVKSTENKQEAGTGYFKKTIDGINVVPAMGNISVTVAGAQNPPLGGRGAWGGIYWQYFEDLDKITTASTPLKLDKKLFIETNTDRGPVLTPVNDGDFLKPGDKIKVRIELQVDRDMEYVHMKDMRASCMEPVNVLSGYKWQGGIGYYETTKDASTNFFIDYLRKGSYVFEYTLFVTHKGNFSNGITSIQCMYAPEFSSHSEGVRVNVE